MNITEIGTTVNILVLITSLCSCIHSNDNRMSLDFNSDNYTGKKVETWNIQ